MKEVIFSCEIKKTPPPPLNFNNNSVKQVQFQKHLGVYLSSKLDFREHLQNMFKKANKTISSLCKLQSNLPRAPLVIIYKLFIGPDPDYRDILYDQTFNSFHERLELIQFKAALAIKGQYNVGLAITGAIRGSAREKIYQELRFESLQQ